MSQKHGVALYIDPPSHHFLGDRLFELSDGRFQSSLPICLAYLRNLLSSKGVLVRTADYIPEKLGNSRNIYVSFGILRNYRQLSRRPDTTSSAFFAMECPIVEPLLYRRLHKAQHHFKRVFSWSDSKSLERFVGGALHCERFFWPQASDTIYEAIWKEKKRKFLMMINTNKLPRVYWQELYTERLRAVEYFSRTNEIDLYGVGWDGPPYRMGQTWVPYIVQRTRRALEHRWQRVRPDPLLKAARRVYKGPVESKAETLGQYTFAVCFENMILKGWITEKMFDCFFAGTIPIYWGAPDIQEHVPSECFIDMRRFAGYEELRGYLRSLSEKDVQRYKENAREYLKSPQFRPFTKDAFAELFARIVGEDTGIRL